MIRLFAPVFNVEKCLEGVRESLEKGWAGYGPNSRKFEDVWKAYVGFEHAVFLNSATAGLDLTFQTLKDYYHWQDDDEVITTPLTFIATNHCILKAGLHPIFADVNDTLCLDPKSVLEHITNRTKAVIFVGMGGNVGDLEEIAHICKQNNLKLILDAAHMSGTTVDGKVVDSVADIAIYSFQSTKVLQTADAGMMCCHDKTIADIIRVNARFGIDNSRTPWTDTNNQKWYYDVTGVGGSYLGNDVMAAIAMAQFETLEDDVLKRREITAKYYNGLKHIKEISFLDYSKGCNSARWLFQILVENRDDLMEYLLERDIETGLHYLDNTEYSMYHYAKGTCPKAKYYSDHVVSLPMHLRLSDEDIQRVIDTIEEYFKET